MSEKYILMGKGMPSIIRHDDERPGTRFVAGEAREYAQRLMALADELSPADPAPTATDEAWLAEIRTRLAAIPLGEYRVLPPEPNFFWRSIGIQDSTDPERLNVIAEVSVIKIQRDNHVEDRSALPEFYAAAPAAIRRLLDALDIYVEREGHYNARLDAKDKTLEAQNAAQQQRIEALEKALRRAIIIMCEEPQGEWRFVKSNQRPPSWDRLIRATDVIADAIEIQNAHTDEEGA